MKDFLYDEMYQDEKNHWWFCARREIILALVEKISRNSNSIDILDTGCGCGYLLPKLQKYGNVYALDYNEHAINYTKKYFGGEIKMGDLNKELPYEEEKFDVILSLDVLEHIQNDIDAMKNIRKILKRNGHYIITVPAHPSMWSYHDENHMHYRRYTKNEMIGKIEKVGFEIEYISYYNCLLFIPIYTIRMLKKKLVKDKEKATDGRIPNKIVNKILYNIFRVEKSRIVKMKQFPFGVSLIAIAKKC